MQSVFISHSSSESALSVYLARWLEQKFPNTSCFCSSRPLDLPPGRKWLEDIFSKARGSDLCLMMLSPYSANNSWLHFEAGMVLGAEIAGNQVVPILYGGITKSCIPTTVQHLEYLFLEDQDTFDAFISEQFLNKQKPSAEQDHSNFIKEMTAQANRIYKHGIMGSLMYRGVKTYPIILSSLRNQEGQNSHILKRYNNSLTTGEIIAVRTSIIPRRIGNIQQWKFGITLYGEHMPNDQKRLFQFHAGCHAGLNSWTLYYAPFENHQVNESARLETELPCGLQLWCGADKASVICVGIDSVGRHSIITNDRSEKLWRLYDNSWTDIIISGWADGHPFQIDINNLEIDTVPYIEPETLSIIGGTPEDMII